MAKLKEDWRGAPQGVRSSRIVVSHGDVISSEARGVLERVARDLAD